MSTKFSEVFNLITSGNINKKVKEFFKDPFWKNDKKEIDKYINLIHKFFKYSIKNDNDIAWKKAVEDENYSITDYKIKSIKQKLDNFINQM